MKKKRGRYGEFNPSLYTLDNLSTLVVQLIRVPSVRLLLAVL